ncbi:hypothetical protein RD792_010945 [Penstemon davidsonii]|uniref:phospholipase A2 n=1 Tax=Penstemon davidsonii TaxID=160366 RepID=A0ABR0D550_9LAMI|nr:hypothetical protein RD792_010945 [Penstemon davidsonii]
MAYYSSQSLIFLILSTITLCFFTLPIHSLDIGLRANKGLKFFNECSRTCESKFCEAPPFLRYGKYCGLLYTGCPGEKPCDQLDACCMRHDQCIARKGNSYLSQQCNNEFKNCVERYRESGAPSFKGNTCDVDEVIKVINDVMRAAIVAGKAFGKP